MADATPLDDDIGGAAGRIIPAGAAPASGEHVFVLGSDAPGHLIRLFEGDFVEVAQAFTYDSSDTLVRPDVLVRGASTPAGTRWVLSATVLGVERWSVALPQEGYRNFPDATILVNVSPQPEEIGFRLRFEGTPSTEYEDVELPAVYLDAFVVEAVETVLPIIFNRLPAPGEVGVPVDAPIILELSEPTGNGLEQSATTVTVRGQLAYNGSTFLPPYNGPGSSFTTLDGGRTFRIVVDPTFSFNSEEQVTVRVVSELDGLPETATEFVYAFVTADIVVPELLSAVAVGHRRVIVVFSEPMGAASVAAATWTLSVVGTSIDTGLPAFPANVVSAALTANPSQVELLLDDDLSPGGAYRVTVVGVEDVAGNEVEAPDNTADFVGWNCAPERRCFNLYRFIPELNRTEDRDYGRDLEKLCKCLQDILDLVLCSIDRWTDIIDPTVAPEAFVDAMLADLGNPFDVELTLNGKRRLVEALIPLYKRKGTAAGIIEATRLLLGIEVDVQVPAVDGIWILGESLLDVDTDLGTNDRALLYSFRVVVNQVITEEQAEEIARIAHVMRSERTHLIDVRGFTVPDEIDHWQLNLSDLGVNTDVHANPP